MGRKPKENQLVIIPREELVQYLVDNHRIFTIAELAENTGYTYSQTKVACDNAGLVPITTGERVKEYIQCNMHLTLDVQAEKLEIKVDSLRYYYKQLGFDTKQAGKGRRMLPTTVAARNASKEIKSIGTIPIEMMLGPIARQYNVEVPSIEIINQARSQLLG